MDAPPSRIAPPGSTSERLDPHLNPFLSSDIFTLQWHITQTCDLRCKHCYDRSERTPLAEEKAKAILENFFDFCHRMHVRGQVTFTGGNPLLYPHIESVYRTASAFGFGIAILGNPGQVDRIRQLMRIARPLYFQISLEGLTDHNDFIRGKGTRCLFHGNAHPDAGRPQSGAAPCPIPAGRVDAFNFNRLYTVGDGAISHSIGLDVFSEKDPFCFASPRICGHPSSA